MAQGSDSGSTGAEAVAAVHRQIVADGVTQFDLPIYVPPQAPDWLRTLFEWLARSGPLVKFVFWAGLATIALLVLKVLYDWLTPIIRRRLRHGEDIEPATWAPDAMPARALLAEAEALAANGAFSEAAHLLLLRSVEQIETRYPNALTPSDTSRDIAKAAILTPDMARAFRLIGNTVESGLFGSRPVGREAWNDCRNAYEAAAFGSVRASSR